MELVREAMGKHGEGLTGYCLSLSKISFPLAISIFELTRSKGSLPDMLIESMD